MCGSGFCKTSIWVTCATPQTHKKNEQWRKWWEQRPSVHGPFPALRPLWFTLFFSVKGNLIPSCKPLWICKHKEAASYYTLALNPIEYVSLFFLLCLFFFCFFFRSSSHFFLCASPQRKIQICTKIYAFIRHTTGHCLSAYD